MAHTPTQGAPTADLIAEACGSGGGAAGVYNHTEAADTDEELLQSTMYEHCPDQDYTGKEILQKGMEAAALTLASIAQRFDELQQTLTEAGLMDNCIVVELVGDLIWAVYAKAVPSK